MNKIIALVLLICSSPCTANLNVGKRVWIALESPFLVDDGYASGVILSVSESDAQVEIRRLEERGERTLYGSCSGALGLPVTAKPATATAETYIQRVPLELISAWRDGQHRFLQRELLGVRFQRWLDQAPGLNPISLDDAIPVAKAVSTQATADAFELMSTMRRARAPLGFVISVDQRADNLAPMAELLTELAMLHPSELQAALQQQKPTNLLGRTLVQVFDRLVTDYHALNPADHPELHSEIESKLTQWVTGDGQWQAHADLRLRLPFLR